MCRSCFVVVAVNLLQHACLVAPRSAVRLQLGKDCCCVVPGATKGIQADGPRATGTAGVVAGTCRGQRGWQGTRRECKTWTGLFWTAVWIWLRLRGWRVKWIWTWQPHRLRHLMSTPTMLPKHPLRQTVTTVTPPDNHLLPSTDDFPIFNSHPSPPASLPPPPPPPPTIHPACRSYRDPLALARLLLPLPPSSTWRKSVESWSLWAMVPVVRRAC